jgi:hypothetical protein
MAWFRAQKVTRELEARLIPPATNGAGGRPGGGPRGKAERKWYGDGGERLKLRVRDFYLPDGTPVTLMIANHPVATLSVQGSRLDFDTESPPGPPVPDVREGEVISIGQGGIILASGRFLPD